MFMSRRSVFLICWGGTLSIKNKVLLNRVVRSASYIVGMTLPAVGERYESYVTKKKTYILKTHIIHCTRSILLLNLAEGAHTNRHCSTFCRQVVEITSYESRLRDSTPRMRCLAQRSAMCIRPRMVARAHVKHVTCQARRRQSARRK